jgi:hypothetical protein
MPIDSRFLKKIDSLIEVQQERNSLRGISDANVTYSLCNRTNDEDDYGANYFVSFELPYKESIFPTGCTLSKRYPELQQLNVDEIIVIPIPPTVYSELIDGRTVEMSIPQYTGTTSHMSAITIYSSTYTGDDILKHESSPLVGNNVAFLFADAINTPYTGQSLSDIGDLIDHAGTTTWGFGLEYADKPSATAWKEIEFTYNTDKRTNAKYAVNVGSTYPDGRAGYNYDVPVGFITLDEGFIIITHTGITSNFPWQSGFTQNGNMVPMSEIGNPSYLKNIYFTGDSFYDLTPLGPDSANPISSVQFYDIDTSFKITAVCLALPREFYISNNNTWNKESAIVNINEESGFISFEPLYITELGLYNTDNELIAIAKTSEPVEKDYTTVVTFNVDIEF